MTRLRLLMPLLLLIAAGGCQGCQFTNADKEAQDRTFEAVRPRLEAIAAAEPGRAQVVGEVIERWAQRSDAENYQLAAPLMREYAAAHPAEAASIDRLLRAWELDLRSKGALPGP